VRLFLDEGAPMVELLRDDEHHGLAGDRARRLLSLNAARDDEAAGSIGAQRLVPASPEQLTERELQVLRLLDSELSGPQIARELFVSHNTLRTHTKHIFSKLEVTTRRAAVRRAHERGLM
jgi:LuxR family maltose regulon positive regulatory protein